MEQPPNHEHVDHQMMKVEVNLDDTPGEWLGYVMDRLFEAGANDVYYTPIYMKKNRPGVLVQLLCHEKILDRMRDILLRETTTLGIRYYPLTVYRMERRVRSIETMYGYVSVKEGLHNGQVISQAPEFEDCRRLAEKHQIPLKKMYEMVWKQMTS
ncbi:hypothetical protein J416_10491 [Gracilibacillus halophilus YIM-C55.5]|uniref:DUF111 family protein n=1 Tax=Gracilibacillus halophilus YIM-C55.5 TaxID=1308866 RepID=N4W8C1_9BACI|nr:nickel insertion protein [Gracilibacillus halophilus]ENH96518.1 hypothetical protein J416_10491 [Gracilibacillus halophilus YIM-C55.5]